MSIITPVILSGGAGTRLWPASRAARPKQLRSLVGPDSLLRQTLDRLEPGEDGLFDAPVIITNAAHAPEIRRQTTHLEPEPLLLLEPVGRNTAACAALAAAWKAAQGAPEGLILLAASDHHMPDPLAFRRAVAAGAEAAREGHIVVFGIRPAHPETGYGYVLKGAPLGEVFEAAAFVEKPDAPTAQGYLAHGGYYWNSGCFLFRADRMLEEMSRRQPAILEAVQASLDAAERSPGLIALDPAAFAACPSDSIDYAIMEKADRVAMAPIEAAWSDLGSWAAIWEASARDASGNAASGEVVLLDAQGCLVRTDGPTVAVVEARDLVVIVEDGAVLIAPRRSAQRVKAVVEALKRAGRDDLL